jgi:multidrug resistance protein, MATE family
MDADVRSRLGLKPESHGMNASFEQAAYDPRSPALTMAQPTLQSDSALAGADAINPLREVWSVAWPTVVAMTSYTIMQFTDKLMVGWVSSTALAAQTSGGIWSFSLLSFALGILTVVNTYVSQNLGAGTPRHGPKYAWAAFWLGVGIYVVFLLPYAVLLPTVFAKVLPLLSPDFAERPPELVEMETGYAQILVYGSIFLLLGRGINQFFFGMHRPHVVTVAAIAGNITNLLGNYILIFGETGIPKWNLPGVPGVRPLGVYGAAISTVIGSAVELSIPAMVFLGRRMHRELGTRAAWRPKWETMKDLLRIGWPAAVQWGNELICWAIFMTILVGSFGKDHLAACAVAFGYMSLSFMPAVGFSVATNSLVGKYIGAGQPETAVARTRLTLTLAMVYMTFCALVFLVFRHQLVDLFLSNTEGDRIHILEIGAKVMVCVAIFQTVDAVGVIYTGALRGAGDTIWPGVMTMIYSWVFIVGGGYAVVQFWPELESVGPWIAAAVYIIVYGVTMWLRFAGGHWRTIKLLKEPLLSPLSPVVAAPPELDLATTASEGEPAT